jgi:hypothetical protein
MNSTITIPKGLAEIAGNRDLITTEEFAKIFNCAEQTVRKNHFLDKKVFGIKPVKVGQRLLWPVIHIAKIINDANKIDEE